MAGLECPPIGDWWEDGWGAIMVPGCWEIMMVPGGSWSCGVSFEDERGVAEGLSVESFGKFPS